MSRAEDYLKGGHFSSRSEDSSRGGDAPATGPRAATEAVTYHGFGAIAFRHGAVCVGPEGPEAPHERLLAHAAETPVEFRVVHGHAQASHNSTLSAVNPTYVSAPLSRLRASKTCQGRATRAGGGRAGRRAEAGGPLSAGH